MAAKKKPPRKKRAVGKELAQHMVRLATEAEELERARQSVENRDVRMADLVFTAMEDGVTAAQVSAAIDMHVNLVNSYWTVGADAHEEREEKKRQEMEAELARREVGVRIVPHPRLPNPHDLIGKRVTVQMGTAPSTVMRGFLSQIDRDMYSPHEYELTIAVDREPA